MGFNTGLNIKTVPDNNTTFSICIVCNEHPSMNRSPDGHRQRMALRVSDCKAGSSQE